MRRPRGKELVFRSQEHARQFCAAAQALSENEQHTTQRMGERVGTTLPLASCRKAARFAGVPFPDYHLVDDPEADDEVPQPIAVERTPGTAQPASRRLRPISTTLPTCRCPVCHRQAPVGLDGRMLTHRSGSQECSGVGRRNTLAQAHHDQLRAFALATATFLMMVDTTQGTYGQPMELKGMTATRHQPWQSYGFIENARKLLFDALIADPELLEGTNLVVRPWDPTASAAALLAGPEEDKNA